jgi:hypothetical protein
LLQVGAIDNTANCEIHHLTRTRQLEEKNAKGFIDRARNEAENAKEAAWLAASLLQSVEVKKLS